MLTVARHITLIAETELDREVVRCWFTCVREHAPKGAVTVAHTVDDRGFPATVSLVHREAGDGKHAYIVPLARDLLDDEAQKIVDSFASENPKLDFDIETSAAYALPPREAAGLDIDQNRYLNLCTALAKKRHEDWMRERTDAGWRYGVKFSERERTHPLLRPWDQLPDRFKQVDLEAPQQVVDLLKDEGYLLVAKDDLDRLLSGLRGS